MSWKIVSFKPGTCEVSVRHVDGELMNFIVPEEHRVSAVVKLAYIQAQTDARDVVKNAEAEAELAKAILPSPELVKATKKLYWLLGVIAVQSIAIVALLIKVL